MSKGYSRLHPDNDWIVCGWFTDDLVYRPLAEQLAKSLDRVSAPYNLVATQKLAGSWEVNTMAKAGHVLAAMDSHPGHAIIFLDVDMTAHGPLAPLASCPGDVALKIDARRRANGSVSIKVNSQIMVIKPTASARRFITAWKRFSDESRYIGDVDQSTLALAFGAVPDCAITKLDDAAIHAVLRHEPSKPGRHQMSGFLRETTNLALTATRTLFRARRVNAQ